MKTLEEIRSRIQVLREQHTSWLSPIWAQEFPETPIGTLCRILKDENYTPRKDKTRQRLGLPRFILIEEWDGFKVRHERIVRPNGRGPVKGKVVKCPHCRKKFPLRGNGVKSKKRPTLIK